MKKLFSVFLIVFILCFSFCYAYDSTFYPTNALSYVATNNDSNFDFTNPYLIAYNYFSQSEYFNRQNYVYILPVTITRSGSSQPYYVSYSYIGSPYPIILDSTSISTINLARQYSNIKFLDGGTSLLPDSYDTTNSFYWGYINIDLSDNSIITNVIQAPIQITRGYYSTLSDFYDSMNSRLQFSRYSSTTRTFIYAGNNDTVSSFSDVIYSKDGEIREIRSSSSDIGIFTDSANMDTTVYSDTFYNVSISRDDISMVSNGTNNFYKSTNIDVSFSNYFMQNISSEATLYYTVIIDSLNYGIVPITEAVNGYSNNRIPLDLSTNTNLLNDINRGLTLVLWYKDGSDVKQGETSYKFYVNATTPTTGTSSSGFDNQTIITGTNGDLPDYTDYAVTNNENLDNAGLTDNSSNGISNADMRSRFKSMFSFFSVAFSWLPREIIVMVEARLCYCYYIFNF